MKICSSALRRVSDDQADPETSISGIPASSSEDVVNEPSQPEVAPRRLLPLLRSSVAARYAKERTRVDDPREIILSRAQVKDLGAYWLREYENKGHSKRTVDFRHDVLRRLDWFLENRTTCDARDGEYYCGALCS